MRTSFRLVIGAALVFCVYFVRIQLLSIQSHLQTLQSNFQLAVSSTSAVLVNQDHVAEAEKVTYNGTAQDKTIVMARLSSEDTNWVKEYLPDWQHAIYTVDDQSTTDLHTPINKGREANAYLTYIIDNYSHLASTIAFLHSHRDGYPAAWHTDAPRHDSVIAMRQLQLDFVQRSGYVNLRCIQAPGCPAEIQPFRTQHGEHEDVDLAFPGAWNHFFNGTEVPPVIATPCCAQFAVSKDQVLKRPLEEYVRMREWLYATELEDGVSGRIFEYLWHIIFGKEAVHCPETSHCWRDVYGRGA